MAIWQTRITHKRLTLSPFSSEQMSDIGSVVLDSILTRIRDARDVTDAPARPLVDRYARRKILRGRAPVRDLIWRGMTLGSMKVKSASEDRVTIGPVNDQADKIIGANNRRQVQWGISPKDAETLQKVVEATLIQARVVKVVKIA